jgi:hypothetical protein
MVEQRVTKIKKVRSGDLSGLRKDNYSKEDLPSGKEEIPDYMMEELGDGEDELDEI